MAVARRITVLDCGLLVVTSWVLYRLIRSIRRNASTTKLRGPKSPSLIFGVSRVFAEGDRSVYYDEWAREYGNVYQIPTTLGTRRTVIFDPKAIAHFYSKESYEYRMPPFERQGLKNFIGEGLLYAEADDHKRQRKAMTPAFSNAAIRSFVPVFYDSAYKVKDAWDAIFDSNMSEDIVVDVQYWMNRVSLDSLGIAAFSHDFESLRGKSSAVIENFEAFAKYPIQGFRIVVLLLAPVFPILRRLPGKRQEINRKYRQTVLSVADELLQKTRADKKSGDLKHDTSKSIIGALVQAENSEGHVGLSEKEVRAQMEVMILAGYETTSISMTWALIELCNHPEKQALLRKELIQLSTEDSTYEQLVSNLPYLDAVMREILRLHPPVAETTRMAFVDDILPLAYPIETANGNQVDTVSLSKGEIVTVPIKALNVSETIWGEDAKKFLPERWINEADLPEKVKELPGYHHLLTFVEGTRMCIGRHFAVAEFKATLSVLIKNYEFSFRDSNAEIEIARALLPRPKLKGEAELSVPLRIRRAEVI